MSAVALQDYLLAAVVHSGPPSADGQSLELMVRELWGVGWRPRAGASGG